MNLIDSGRTTKRAACAARTYVVIAVAVAVAVVIS